MTDGSWTAGGTGNNWAWGQPAKAVIRSAGEGNKCWVTGGLTGTGYASAEASWLRSPCFDLSTIQNPYIEFLIFWIRNNNSTALRFNIHWIRERVG